MSGYSDGPPPRPLAGWFILATTADRTGAGPLLCGVRPLGASAPRDRIPGIGPTPPVGLGAAGCPPCFGGGAGGLAARLTMHETGQKHLSMTDSGAAGLTPPSHPVRRPTECAQNHSVRESGTTECSSRRREARCSGGTSDRGDAQGQRQPGQHVSGNPHPQPPLGTPGSLTAVSETARKTFDSWRKKCT